MRNKYKAFFLSILILSSLVTFGQFKVAPVIGLNFAKMKLSNNDANITSRTSYHIGGIAEYDFYMLDNLSLQFGVLYSNKGMIMQNDSWKITNMPKYIDLPLLAMYKLDVTALKFEFGFGISYGIGVGGTIKTEFKNSTLPSVERKIIWGTADSCDFKRGDLSLRFSAGFRTNTGFFMNMNYEYGLSDINPTKAIIKNTISNRCFGISAGFMIGEPRKFRHKRRRQ